MREYAFWGFLSTDLHKSNICICLSIIAYKILKCLAKRNMHHVPKVKGPNNTVHVFLFFFILLNFNKANILHNYSIYLYSRITSMYFKQTLIYYYWGHNVYCHIQILIFLILNLYMTIIVRYKYQNLYRGQYTYSHNKYLEEWSYYQRLCGYSSSIC